MSKENLEHIHKAYTPSNPNNLKENIRAKFCSIDKFIFASGRCFHVPFHVLFLLQPLEGREEKGQGQVSVVSTHATEQEEPGDIGVGWGLKGHLARHHTFPTASQRGKWKQKGEDWCPAESCTGTRLLSSRPASLFQEAGKQGVGSEVVWKVSLRTREKMNSQSWPRVTY